MINKKKISLIIIVLLLTTIKSFTKESVFIVYNVNNEIITNIDIEKESRYLNALNNQLKNLDKNKVSEIAKESSLRERVKKIELSKYFNLDVKNSSTDFYIKNFYKKLKFDNQNEFENYLKKNKLTLNYIEKKINIEIHWNQLIYDKYKNQVNIDIEKLKNELKNNNNISEKVYLLSEIIFEKNTQNNFNEKFKNIKESIKEIGFKNTANIYSISDSAKFGGDIGWIEERKLSQKFLKSIKNLKIGEYTIPIQVGSSFLILKIDNIKIEKKLIDDEQELKKKIQFETSRRLEQFSKNYYNMIKINTIVNEL